MADQAADILFGCQERHHNKLWGEDERVILSRYLLPKMRGVKLSPSSSEAEKEWAEQHYHKLYKLWKQGSGDAYRLDDADRLLLRELISWCRRPGAFPITHFSELDSYRSTEDLLTALEYLLI